MTKKKAPELLLAENIARARLRIEKRARAVSDLANAAADEAANSERGNRARQILAAVGARVQQEATAGVPVQFRTDPEQAIADALERAAGAKFTEGRKVGTTSPIRRRMAELLRKSPGMRNADLWAAIKSKPPRGWDLVENRVGKYASGPTGVRDMSYARFCNVAAELRRELEG